MSIEDAAFETLVTEFAGGKPQRVWSLIVTIFGDLAQGRDQWITGTALTSITACLGIKPQATRTALHRLRKDNWLISRRDGRHYEYALTDRGRRLSAQASPRIYGPAQSGPIYLSVVQNGLDLPPGVVSVAPNTWLSGTRQPNALNIDTDGFDLPDWMRAALCDRQLLESAAKMHLRLSRLSCDTLDGLCVLQATSLRVLIVHRWRRLVLKSPALPDRLFPANWQGAECRKLTHDLLAVLPPPSLCTFNAGSVAA